MNWQFGKDIETRHGSFAIGQPLPPEWDTRETRKQLVDQFGEGVIVQAQAVSNEAVAMRLSAIEQSLEEIKATLGIKDNLKEGLTGKAKGRA